MFKNRRFFLLTLLVLLSFVSAKRHVNTDWRHMDIFGGYQFRLTQLFSGMEGTSAGLTDSDVPNSADGMITTSSALSLLAPQEEPKKLLAPLRDQASSELESQLRLVISSNAEWARLISQRRMAIGLVDLSVPGEVRYASLNGRHMMYAASLPKIAVLAAALDAIERGELESTEEVRQDLRLMIARSNNAATTRTIDRIGFEAIERTMTDEEHQLYDPEFGGGLWVGKRYAAGGRRVPDPLRGISHAATAEQVCRFYYLLTNNALVSPEASSEMRSYLVDPQLHHKFVNTLDEVAPNAQVYRKSGSWRNFHADSALVQGAERNYIMVALIEDENGEQHCREIARVLDELMMGGV